MNGRALMAWVMVGLAATAFATRAHSVELSAKDLYERAAPSVWLVRTYDGENMPLSLGSAVVVAPSVLVTNCHVLAKARRISVSQGEQRHAASLELADPERDLCQLRAQTLQAPAVPLGDSDKVSVGDRIYTLGNPRGLLLTLSEGLVSALRKGREGKLFGIQISAPISAGSSGGGLFDAHGHLVGLTTLTVIEGQNLNFAIPINWLAELPERSARASVGRSKGDATQESARGPDRALEPPPVDSAPGSSAGNDALRPGDRVVYRITDRLTGKTRLAEYRVDRLEPDRVIFNGGGRVEHRGGGVISIEAPLAGELEECSPPDGWAKPGSMVGTTWAVKYAHSSGGSCAGVFELRARITAEEQIPTKVGALAAQRIDYEGYQTGPASSSLAPARFFIKSKVWYSPALARVVRFEFDSTPMVSGGFMVPTRVIAELMAVR